MMKRKVLKPTVPLVKLDGAHGVPSEPMACRFMIVWGTSRMVPCMENRAIVKFQYSSGLLRSNEGGAVLAGFASEGID